MGGGCIGTLTRTGPQVFTNTPEIPFFYDNQDLSFDSLSHAMKQHITRRYKVEIPATRTTYVLNGSTKRLAMSNFQVQTY
jgi:hypothetical protein